MALLDMTAEEYDQVRGNGHFVVVNGHEDVEIERVVAERNGYVVVDKY
jgi:hypothetical protein